MLVFFLAAVLTTLVTIIYVYGSSALVLTYTRIAALIVTALLAGELSLGIASAIWDYLVANSFCPWIMIFRGRPGTVIIAEAANHAHNLTYATNLDTIFSSLVNLGALAAELIGGPALGILLTAVFVFLTYKCMAVIFSKLFNRK